MGSVRSSIKNIHIIKYLILEPTAEILQRFSEAVQPITEEIYTNHCESQLISTTEFAIASASCLTSCRLMTQRY